MPANKASELTRREFVIATGAAVTGALIGTRGETADLPPLQETDSIAVSMGYKVDTTKVDAKKYPNHKPDQTCANCRFYQADAKAASGPCQIFPGKSVSAKGWCQVWAAK